MRRVPLQKACSDLPARPRLPLTIALPEALVARGDALTHLSSVDSTMDEARRLFMAGDVRRHWIVADAQSGGRGRSGRAWSSPSGNLHLTVLMLAPCALRHQPKLGFVAGVALQAAIGGAARLKWPNDILVDGAKVAGLLLEGLGNGAAVAIGIGVNVSSHPDGVPYPATTLTAHDPDASVARLFQQVALRLDATLDSFGDGSGFEAIRRAWLSHAAFLGKTIAVRQDGSDLAGVFRDIDPDGHLILGTAEGDIRIAAGDVFPLDN
jgi:BirA family transcriptional regulator, biotin operon repressor / biotin---[acetyl-CoA-carboxylase] ligase